MLDPFDDIRLHELVLFDRLVRLGTITAAARELGVPKPTASRWLTSLEQHVGQPLLRRGARNVVLTDGGQAFHAALQPVLRGLLALRGAAREDIPGGTLRVSVPVPFGRLVGGRVIAAFHRQMPGVRLEVTLDNARVDLVRGRLDLAIRGGALPDSDLVARRLATVPLWLYASARYEGVDADDIPLIAAPGDEALLRSREVKTRPAAVIVDDRTAVRDALCAGAGAGVLPAFLGEPHRADGELIRVRDEALSAMRVHAVFLPEQRGDTRVLTLITLIEEEMRPWSEPAADG